MNKKVGFELEMLVLDEFFNERNDADILIAEAKKQGLAVNPECSHAMVEVNSKPGSLAVAAEDLLMQLDGLNAIAAYNGLRVLPIEMPLNHDFKPVVRASPRYDAKRRLLGEDRFEISGKVMGFHVHYDLPSADEHKMRQINFLKLVDPLAIAATASSPHQLGDVSFDNWRTHSYRYIVHGDLPFQGQLQQFGTSYATYVQEHLEKYLNFLKMSEEMDVDFSQYANEYNSIWGPTRINPDYQTSEIRSMGASPDIASLFGLAGIINGGLRTINSSAEMENMYLDIFFGGKSNPKDSYNLLQALSDDAMRYGFKTEGVNDYCSSLIDFCTGGLSLEEDVFASHTKSVVASRKNFSDMIVAHSDIPIAAQYARLHDTYISSLEMAKNLVRKSLEVNCHG